MVVSKKFQNFFEEVTQLAENDDTSLVDAIIHYTHKHNIEIEAVAEMISKSPVLKSRLEEEASDNNLLVEKISRLSF